MQISLSQMSNAPAFQRKLTLPSKDVMECITGIPQTKTDENLNSMLNTIKRIFKIKKEILDSIVKTPLAYDLYVISSGKMLMNKNENLEIIAKAVKNLPREERPQKIHEVIKEMGDKINVIL